MEYALWQSVVSVPLAGAYVPTIAPSDLLPILCLHGMTHLWERMEWICALGALIRNHPEIDLEEGRELAVQYGRERMYLLGLYLAHVMTNTPLPETLRRRMESDRAIRYLAIQVQKRLFRAEYISATLSEIALFHMRTFERVQDRGRYAFHRMIMLTERDLHALAKPPAFLPLYYISRVIRLTARYSWRPFGR